MFTMRRSLGAGPSHDVRGLPSPFPTGGRRIACRVPCRRREGSRVWSMMTTAVHLQEAEYVSPGQEGELVELCV